MKYLYTLCLLLTVVAGITLSGCASTTTPSRVKPVVPMSSPIPKIIGQAQTPVPPQSLPITNSKATKTAPRYTPVVPMSSPVPKISPTAVPMSNSMTAKTAPRYTPVVPLSSPIPKIIPNIDQATATIAKPTPRPQRIYNHLATFYSIKGSGNFSLEIRPARKAPRVVLEGDDAGVAMMSVFSTNDTLYLRREEPEVKKGETPPLPTPVKVIVYAPPLMQLVYSGVGNIHATHFHSPGLEMILNHEGTVEISGRIGLRQLILRGRGQTIIRGVDSRNLNIVMSGGSFVQLRGIVNLTNLDIDGQGYLDLYWVNSRMLTIIGRGSAGMRLAGIADKFYVQLFDRAKMDAKYLRTNETFVETWGYSTADVRVAKDQNAVARDASTVYFYKEPQLEASFMAAHGAILDMQGVPRYLWDQN